MKVMLDIVPPSAVEYVFVFAIGVFQVRILVTLGHLIASEVGHSSKDLKR